MEEFNLSNIKITLPYPVNSIISNIISFYIERENKEIKDLFIQNRIQSMPYIRDYLITKINELNKEKIDNNGFIKRRTRTISIPEKKEFFSKAFPNYFITETGDNKISFGVLDEMNNLKELEEVVAGAKPPSAITQSLVASCEINSSLHKMKINTIPDPYTFDSSVCKIDTDIVKEAIKIFQKEYMDTQKPPIDYTNDQLCKNTILAMNNALKEKWTREIYFYQKIGSDESYVNDLVINTETYVDKGIEIFAKEKNKTEETFLGKKVYYQPQNLYGIQRYASAPSFYEQKNTSAERVIYAIAKNEGSIGDNYHGGYNAINTYDDAALSIGLFHWNNDYLWDLLSDYKKQYPQNYDMYITKYGLNISDNTGGVRKFLVDGNIVHSNFKNLGELRKLKFVYCFIKAATDPNFRSLQIKHAEIWIKKDIIETKFRDKPRNVYITSEHGIALVVDLSVNAGHYSKLINDMLHNVFNVKLKNTADNPSSWNDDIEKDIIKALIDYRSTKVEGMIQRTTNIKNSNLDEKRNSFKL